MTRLSYSQDLRHTQTSYKDPRTSSKVEVTISDSEMKIFGLPVIRLLISTLTLLNGEI